MPLNADMKKMAVTAKLVGMVVLITVMLILVILNFQTRTEVNLIFVKVYVWPSLTIMVSFGLGMLFTGLVLLIRRARRR